MRFKLTLGFLVLFAAGVLIGLGCKSPQSQARAVAQEFVRAADTKDAGALDATLTRAARERGVARTMFSGERNSTPATTTVGEATVDGTSAQVAITSDKNEPGKLLLRKEDGNWRVWGVQMTPKDAPFGPMTLNFEKPEAILGDMARGFGQALGSALKGFAEGMEKGLAETPRTK
jgi:hypothetical protein